MKRPACEGMRAVGWSLRYRDRAKLNLQTSPAGQLGVPAALGGEGVGRRIGRMLKYAVVVPTGSQQVDACALSITTGPTLKMMLSPMNEVCLWHSGPRVTPALKSPGQLETVNWMSAPLLRPPPSTTCIR